MRTRKKRNKSIVSIEVDVERGCVFCTHKDVCHLRKIVEGAILESRDVEPCRKWYSESSSINRNTIRTYLGNACHRFTRDEDFKIYNVGQLNQFI